MANETEEQKIAALKKWWGENATSIIFGVAIGLAGVFGSKAWFGHQQDLSERAAAIYTVMMQELDGGNWQRVSDRAGSLVTEYSSTPYASLAALALAKVQIQKGNLDAANSQLQWVLDNGKIDVVNEVARLRLARVLVAQQRLDEAEALLKQPRGATAFDSLYDEVAGDIYSARGDAARASESYQHALAATPENNPEYQQLQLKYENTLAGRQDTNEVLQ